MSKLMKCISLVCALLVGLAVIRSPAYEPVRKDVKGWTVFFEPALFDEANRETGDKVLQALSWHLEQIVLIVPEARLAELRRLEIRVDLSHPELRAMQYHPDRRWLIGRGYDPSLQKQVHIPRGEYLFSRGLMVKQPWVVLHELAHAYHDQVLGFDHPDILAAYERTKASGLLDSVLLYNGRKGRHYALKDHKEFFAELTEAYFGRNDFYPFVNAELREFDPETYALMEKIWGPVR